MATKRIYATSLPSDDLPSQLRSMFGDLDQLCTDLLCSARIRVTLVSPFWSPQGTALLASSLAVAAERGALIRLVADNETSSDALSTSIASIRASELGAVILPRLRVLKTREAFPFIHAKLILVDGSRGYLGSANLTTGGLRRNFELGVRLDSSQTEALEQMIAVFQSKGMLVDHVFP